MVFSCAIKQNVDDFSLTKKYAIFSDGAEKQLVSFSLTGLVSPMICIDSTKRKSGIADLSPTHRVERVMIENIDLIHALESDTSVFIYYQPDDTGGFMEEANEETIWGSTIECKNHPMPLSSLLNASPFYVIVPIDYNLPENLNSTFLFETFIPNSGKRVEKEQVGPGRPVTPAFVTGVLRSYDNRLNAYTPIANAKVNYYSDYSGATVPSFTYTNASGEFRLESPSMQEAVTVSLQNSKYKVRNGMSTNVYTMTIGTLSNLLSYPSTHLTLNYPTNFFFDVYKAARYYFYSSNSLLSAVTKYDSSGSSIDIFAVNGPDLQDGYLGYFMPSSSPYIVIYNPYISNYSGASSMVFGTVLHELGHATNYVSVGVTNMNTTDPIIKESFASFFGWYNVSVFYSSVASSPSMVNDICTQGRQKWTISSSTVSYSPFFIDLYEDYNQHTSLGLAYNDDPISNVALSAILSLAIGPKLFSYVYYYLASFIGTYFTGSEYTTFVAPYSPLL